ncbi:hypothetical protein QJS10_CPA06g01953 [Acorus calamus]|uniref:Uncharacterized protein n=1 Tax=Acorus calamus TaxID=4465 RepID=A0AAV9EKD7_ACOCL|nr:hypothetical protein QJS10_CPA06g01953 [Acorus calamus]
MEAIDVKWSESVEDLLDRGDSESASASALLHSLIAKLDFPSSSADLRLVSTLTDLARIYSSRSLSFKADKLRERALLVRARAQRSVVPAPPVLGDFEDLVKEDSGGVRVSASAEGDDDETPRQPLKERGSERGNGWSACLGYSGMLGACGVHARSTRLGSAVRVAYAHIAQSWARLYL